MRTLLLAIVTGVAFVSAPMETHAEEIFLARLHGGNEAPPVDSDGIGFGMAVISDRMNEIGFFVGFDNLSTNATVAHIHVGQPGVAGPIIFNIGPPPAETGGFFFGTLTAADFTPAGGIDTFEEALNAIRTGGTYFNVHSVMHPSGEIRGQLRTYE
jgi:hypothetical protein